jgi:chemotaxis protein CheX
MDVKYINPFLKAVTSVFDTMIDIPVSIGKPRVKKEPIPPYDISGIIGLSGGVTGCVVIHLSEKLALHLASKMLDERFTELDADCSDAIGEIANMIAGNAKNDFPGKESDISVPSIVIGEHKMAYPKETPIISIPCSTDAGDFCVDIAFKANG